MRGTIGGHPGENLTPVDIVEMAASFGQMIKKNNSHPSIVIGRDGRISGNMVSQLCIHTLVAQGFIVYDAGLSTTPTIEMAVTKLGADAGIIITASHNPIQWNALKFLNEKGEFISAAQGQELIRIAHEKQYLFNEIHNLGKIIPAAGLIEHHIDAILNLPLVNKNIVADKKFKVVVDCINSTGAISVAPLLEALGCEVILINEEMTGNFAHNPEPLAQHLQELCERVISEKAEMGIAVDPDVDRLSFICEDGSLLGEENTLVSVANYILQHTPGATVSNLSSTRGLKDITLRYGMEYHAAAVGEVNVVEKMKEVNAIIGGEGNGGIIYPALHYGRDALVGIALMLTYMAENNLSLTQIKASLPQYFISKNKIDLQPGWNVTAAINGLIDKYSEEEINTSDGLKIDFAEGWVQLRQSNTEPIIRVYSESYDEATANRLAEKIIGEFKELIG
ncbi:MAG: phosphoglucosamine mutase [Candidatus Parvibacillus calidus]|nr:MAG: phosphoglucosamine mutase [Candidatus Parvibacillus calidus]